MIVLIVIAFIIAVIGAAISTERSIDFTFPVIILTIAIGVASFTWFGAKICPTCERVTKDSYCKNCGTENVCYFCYEEDVPDGE